MAEYVWRTAKLAGAGSGVGLPPRLGVVRFGPVPDSANTPAQADPFFSPTLFLEERRNPLLLHFSGALCRRRRRSLKRVEVHLWCLRLSIGRA